MTITKQTDKKKMIQDAFSKIFKNPKEIITKYNTQIDEYKIREFLPDDKYQPLISEDQTVVKPQL